MAGLGRTQALKTLKNTGYTVNKVNSHYVQEIVIENIITGSQPRQRFGEIENLATSIKENGLLNPVSVMENKDNSDTVTLIAGERRLRAFKLLDRHKIPCIVFPYCDKKEDILSKQIIENIQREDLTIIERSNSIALFKSYGIKIKDLAEKLGLNRRTIERYLRIDTLSDTDKKLIEKNDMSLRDIHKRFFEGTQEDKPLNLKVPPFIKRTPKSIRFFARKLNFSGLSRCNEHDIRSVITDLEDTVSFLKKQIDPQT